MGRAVPTQWVFGDIDPATQECFLVPVERRVRKNKVMSILVDEKLT